MRYAALKDALKTGGYHMTCDDIFISTEMGHRTKSKKTLMTEKAWGGTKANGDRREGKSNIGLVKLTYPI